MKDQSFIDQHGGIAEAELILCKSKELHRILEQARPGGEGRGDGIPRARG